MTTRDQRQEITRRALADSVRERMSARRLRQTNVARDSGISRTFLREMLAAQKGCTLVVFLELSRHGLATDPCELLRDVLNRRDALRGSTIDK